MLYYYYPLSGLLTAVLAATLGLFVYTRDPTDRRYITYGIFCLTLAVWGFAYSFWLLSQTDRQALFWARTFMAAAVFIPVTAYHHVIQLIGNSSRAKYRLIKVGYLLSAGLFLLSPTAFLVSDVSEKLNFKFWPNPGPAFHLHFLMFVFFAYDAVSELYQAHKTSTGRRRNHLRILLVIISLAFLGGGTNYPLWYDIPLPPAGNIFVALYVLVFAYAIVAYRLMDINIVVRQSITYSILLLLLLLPCLVILTWGQKIFFSFVDLRFSIISAVILLTAGFIFPRLRLRTQATIERILFGAKYDYRRELLQFSREMVSLLELKKLIASMTQTLVRSMGVKTVTLYLLDGGNNSYQLMGSIGFGKDEVLSSLPVRDPFIHWLKGEGKVVVKEELELLGRSRGISEVIGRLREMQSEVCVPLFVGQRLMGFCNLGEKLNREMYSHEDLELLSALANQAAIAIDNARLYENLKQSQDLIRRADRLSSLGMLTAGLAHEIRNPLVAIRTFTQLLPERYQEPEFRNNFQALALKEVDRICGLVNDLLSFARPTVPNVSAENVNEIVESIVRILETEGKERGIQIYRRLGAHLPKIFIDKEQIKQVSMNVILNALQSIEGRGAVEVSTRPFTKNGSKQYVQIEVRDSGVGIPEKDIEDIFTPFFTTKKDGSGLGLSISHQIVQEHGGYIVVESQVGRGTTFFINLPVRQPDHQETKDRPQVHEEDSGR